MKGLKILMAITAFLFLFGCEKPADTVEFYYLREEISYETSDGVMVPEYREAEGSLSELLDAYLQGPVSGGLISPFPTRIQLEEVRDEGSFLVVVLNDRIAALHGMDLTLACGCLARTCFALTDATEVRISAKGMPLDGQHQIIITTETLLLSEGA